MGLFRLLFRLLTFLLLLVGCFGFVSGQASISDEKLMIEAKKYEQLSKFDSAMLVYKKIEQRVKGPQKAKINLKLANAYREQKVYDTARIKLDSFSLLTKEIKGLDHNLIAEFYFVDGKLRADLGDYTSAIDQFNQAIIHLKKEIASDQELLSRIFNYLGIAHHFLGNFDSALKNYRQALRFHVEQHADNMDFADILQNIAIIHIVKGNFDSADIYIQRSKQIRELHILADDQKMVTFYVNYGRFLLMLGNHSESLELYQKAEELLKIRGVPNEEHLGPVLINIGNAFQLRGDYEKAAAYYQNAIHVLNRVFESGHPYLVTVENNLAFVHNLLGKYDLSWELSKKNETVITQPTSKIRLYRNMARSYQGLNDNIEAQYYFLKAVRIAKDLMGLNHYEYGASLIDYAEFLLIMDNPEEALRNFVLAKQVYENVFNEHDSELAILIRRIGVCYLNLHQFEMTETYFAQTEDLLRNVRLADDYRKMLLTDLFFDKGKLYKKWYDRTKDADMLHLAFENFQKAIAQMDDFSQAISDESRMTLGENLRSGFLEAMGVAFELYRKTSDVRFAAAAFEIVGKSKSVVLLSSVRKNQALLSSQVPDEIIGLERNIKQDIVSLSKLITEERQRTISNELKTAYFEEQRLGLIKKYDSLLGEIESHFPEYYSLRYDMSVVSLNRVQELLKPDELLIEYLMGDDDCFIVAIDKNNIRMERHSLADSIASAISELRQQSLLNFSGHGREQLHRYIELTSKLYHWLLGPVSDMLNEKRLLIVPDGVIGYLPFEMLVNPEKLDEFTAEQGFYQDLPYLLYDHPVSYTYSSTLRFSTNNRKSSSAKGIKAYVPDYRLGFQSDVDSLIQMKMQPLPFAREEAENILRVWKNGKILTASDASKMNFLKTAGDAHIIHLAMHAIIDDENPLFSRLIFQQDNISAESYALNTYELYSMQLNASLAVLSACNTGLGALRYGEGVISLTRGFIYAGVPSILMSSWEVNDRSGAMLMESFYQYLYEGYSKDVALQKARIDYLKSVNMLKSHPFFWGTYMLIGDNMPVEKQKNHQFLFYFAALFFVIVFFAYKKLRR